MMPNLTGSESVVETSISIRDFVHYMRLLIAGTVPVCNALISHRPTISRFIWEIRVVPSETPLSKNVERRY